MPQLASLSWLFLSFFFILFFLVFSVSLWWLNYSKVFFFSVGFTSFFNHWDW